MNSNTLSQKKTATGFHVHETWSNPTWYLLIRILRWCDEVQHIGITLRNVLRWQSLQSNNVLEKGRHMLHKHYCRKKMRRLSQWLPWSCNDAQSHTSYRTLHQGLRRGSWTRRALPPYESRREYERHGMAGLVSSERGPLIDRQAAERGTFNTHIIQHIIHALSSHTCAMKDTFSSFDINFAISYPVASQCARMLTFIDHSSWREGRRGHYSHQR